MRNALSVVAVLSTALAIHAADGPDITEAMRAHRMPIRIERGAMSGPGADMLRSEAKDSQFFLIGEDHGGRETAEFADAVFSALQPLGYRHIAIEAGPITGETLESLARRGGVNAIRDFAKRYPFTLPFFMWDEETQYLARVVAANKDTKGRIVWGVDQEFETSPAFHIDRLLAVAATDAQRSLAAATKAQITAGYARMVVEHNPTVDYLMSATPATFDTLLNAFHGNAEAEHIVGELRDSAGIYQMWTKGQGFASNEARAAMMRKHFTADYNEAVAAGERAPRVMGKFGANHVFRGLNFTNVYDLGTYLPEIAELNGSKAFQVVLLAPSGHVNAYFPFSANVADKEKVYSPSADAPDLNAAALFAAAIPGEWTVIDFRPVRALAASRKANVDPALRRLIFGFDAAVVIPEVHPTTLIE